MNRVRVWGLVSVLGLQSISNQLYGRAEIITYQPATLDTLPELEEVLVSGLGTLKLGDLLHVELDCKEHSEEGRVGVRVAIAGEGEGSVLPARWSKLCQLSVHVQIDLIMPSDYCEAKQL